MVISAKIDPDTTLIDRDFKMTAETPDTPQAGDATVAELSAELEQYRQRLVDDTMSMAQKLKLPKKSALAKLDANPEIARIDTMLAELRGQHPGA